MNQYKRINYPDNTIIMKLNYSKRFNGNDLMVRFKIGLPCFINRLSLMSSLKCQAKTSKSSKLMMQSHCKRWSETADSFIFFTRFSVKLEIPICSAALVKNVGKFYHNK